MPNGSENNSQSQDIGSLLLQADRWARIEDGVKAGVPISGIARGLLEEDQEIHAHYERTGSTNPQKTLSNVIAYHVREKISVSERIGYKQFRYFFEREVGDLNVVRELKQMVDLQKERTAKAIELERRLGMVTVQAGREMMVLNNILGTLGKLKIAAGLDIEEQPELMIVNAEEDTSERGRVFYTFLELLRRHGYSDKKAIELVTGISDLTGASKDEPDPLGLSDINLIDLMHRAENAPVADEAVAASY